MNVNGAIMIIVLDCGPTVTIKLKASESEPLNIIQYVFNFILARAIRWAPGNNSAGIPIFKR